MAKDKNASTPAPAPVMAQNQLSAPEGWEKEATGFPPYWTPSEGACFRGIVTGFDPDSENDGAFPRFTLLATAPITCYQGPKDDQVAVNIVHGDRFNVSQYASLPLENYMGCEVFVMAVNKRSIDGGKTLWNFELRVSAETKRLVAERQAKMLAEANAAIPS